jgi:putative DNA primase/helicase
MPNNSQADSAIKEFQAAAEAIGLVFAGGGPIGDGKPHRTGTAGKENGQDGFFVLHLDPPASGFFQNNRTGESCRWTHKNGRLLSAEERAAYRARALRDKETRAAEQAHKYADAAQRAQAKYGQLAPAGADHPYYRRKGIPGPVTGVRVTQDGRLVVPVYGDGGKIESLQFIGEDGAKLFMRGGRTRGGLFVLKGRDPAAALVICEGLATGVSIYRAVGGLVTVLVAFFADNLRHVAQRARKRYPDRAIVVACDNDRQTTGNPGVAKGRAAAAAVGGLVAVPDFADGDEGSDFNDLAVLESPGRVAEIIAAALADPAPPPQDDGPPDDYGQCPPPEYYDGPPMDDTPPAGRRKPQKATPTEPHLIMARRVLAALGVGNVRFWQSRFWRWDGGVWRPFDDRAARQIIHDVCGAEIKSRSTVDSVLDLAKTEAFADLPPGDQDGRVVNVRNGELHWAGDRWDFRPHDRERFSTSQIPVDYAPLATAPRFEQFLGEVFRDDPDRLEKSVIVCEAFGYSLLTTCEFEKFFLLIGAGANGKSVLLRLLQDLLGVENVAAVQPSQFDNRFQRAHLFGKLANIITEIAEGAEIADAQLKAIVSGELTTAERKMQPPFDFRPFSTSWFGSNHRPHTRDFSAALFRRAIVIEFNRVIEPHEQDQRLGEKLRAELPGVLNLALESMAGVFARGGFTTAPSVEAAKASWRLEADQVAQFVEESCVLDPAGQIASGELYAAYGTWADESGIRRKLNRRNFTIRLSRFGVEVAKGGRGVRCLNGVRLASC